MNTDDLDKIEKNVFALLIELYGLPAWMANPKSGQKPEEIKRRWAEELGVYSPAQLQKACLRLYKYRKAASFPSLSHLKSELCEENPQEETPRQVSAPPPPGFCLESELMARDKALGRCGGTYRIYCRAVTEILEYRLPRLIGWQEFRRLEKNAETPAAARGAKYQLALRNGLFDDWENLLAAARRPCFVHSSERKEND